MCKWLGRGGVDAIHVSSGNMFPHPKNPAGDLPIDELMKTYDTLISSGRHTLAQLSAVPERADAELVQRRWDKARGDVEKIEGMNLPDARGDQGGGQRAGASARAASRPRSVIRQAIERQELRRRVDRAPAHRQQRSREACSSRARSAAPKPCTYCNKCLVNAVENPLGCYDVTRFPSREEMVREIMTRVRVRRRSSERHAAERRNLTLSHPDRRSLGRRPLRWPRRRHRAAGNADSASFPDIVDHFKYGSIGAEERAGIPLRIWRVLPIVFADKLPKRPGTGYERIGFLFEPDAPHGRPIGTSFTSSSVDRVGLNCATCHVGTIRDTPGQRRGASSLGMPANQMDLQAYARFLTACAHDPRFNADTLIEAIRKEDP